MRKALIVLAAVAAVAVAFPIRNARGQEAHPQGNDLLFVSADQLKFEDSGGGTAAAVVWGDPDKGPHGAFTKFKPGFDAGLHTHSNDVWLVVLEGAYLYKDEAGEKRVGPGSFIRIPGGKKHWSGGDAKEGALFYQESSGKFDLVHAK